jgi:hypothetical protein
MPPLPQTDRAERIAMTVINHRVIELLPFTAANILVDISRGSTQFTPSEAKALALAALSIAVSEEILANRESQPIAVEPESDRSSASTPSERQNMKGILIDPFAKSITEVDHSGELDDLYRTLECDTVDVVIVSGNIFAHSEGLYVDDNGYGKAEDGKPQAFFRWGGLPDPIAGKALLLGGEGDKNASTHIKLEEVQAKVEFINARFLGMDVKNISDRGTVGISVRPRMATSVGLPGLPGSKPLR